MTTFGAVITDDSAHYVHIGTGMRAAGTQFYFHRPIAMLLNAYFRNGFVRDWMEDPTLPESAVSTMQRPLSWLCQTSSAPIY